MKIDLGLTWNLLLVAFVVLKLTEVITWSWFWVLTPVWGLAILYLVWMGLGLLLTD